MILDKKTIQNTGGKRTGCQDKKKVAPGLRNLYKMGLKRMATEGTLHGKQTTGLKNKPQKINPKK